MRQNEYAAREQQAQSELAKAWKTESTPLADLHARLAKQRVSFYGATYDGAEEDALTYVRNNYPTAFDAALACDVFGC